MSVGDLQSCWKLFLFYHLDVGLQDNIDRLRCEIDQIFDEEDLKKVSYLQQI